MSLSSAYETLTRNKNLDQEKLSVLVGQLSTSLENARAAVKEMRRIAPQYEIDTEPLYRYQDILGVMKGIAQDARIEMSGVQAYWEEMAGKRERFHAGRETIARMQDDLIKAKNKYRHHARILHDHRVEAGKKLSEAITSELPPLKLMKAEFAVKVEEIANLEWTEKGLDTVTFTARMNPGQPFSPVSETASGGELARLILALKVVLQKVVTIPTLIFDEVDTGIGGAAAAAVGERLALLSDDTQVLVITHSPQVASRGEQHLHVSKKTDGITTTSIVTMLGIQERVDEISRMLAGDTITAEAAAAARKLIEEATLASQARRLKRA
jgi:DNA repair protein RecN (Recombination protein N)